MNDRTQNINNEFIRWTNELREHINQKDQLLHSVLRPLLSDLNKGKRQSYNHLRSAVYNKDFDNLTGSNINLIVIGDNPGKNEQELECYFSKKSGKTLREFINASGYKVRPGWVQRNKDQKDRTIASDDEVLIFNKSYIHTCLTSELQAHPEIKKANDESQIYMANKLIKLVKIYLRSNRPIEVWIVGLSGLSNIFSLFLDILMNEFDKNQQFMDIFHVFKHPACVDNRDDHEIRKIMIYDDIYQSYKKSHPNKFKSLNSYITSLSSTECPESIRLEHKKHLRIIGKQYLVKYFSPQSKIV